MSNKKKKKTEQDYISTEKCLSIYTQKKCLLSVPLSPSFYFPLPHLVTRHKKLN